MLRRAYQTFNSGMTTFVSFSCFNFIVASCVLVILALLCRWKAASSPLRLTKSPVAEISLKNQISCFTCIFKLYFRFIVWQMFYVTFHCLTNVLCHFSLADKSSTALFIGWKVFYVTFHCLTNVLCHFSVFSESSCFLWHIIIPVLKIIVIIIIITIKYFLSLRF